MIKRRVLSSLIVAGLMTTAVSQPAVPGELPAGGRVTAGDATIEASGPAGMTIRQSTDKAIVTWDSFSISRGNSVLFNNGSGATLNRVTGGDLSEIHGSLKASGSIFLINPNGVLVGESGVIETGGSFIASTLDVSSAEFLAGGDLTFRGDASSSVVNLGRISSLGGDVALISRSVVNEGVLSAREGTVGLAAGREILLRDAALDDGKFQVRIGTAGDGVTEAGAIEAAVAELKTNGGNIYALAGNGGGEINATGFSESGGRVFLGAGGGAVRVSKTVRARRSTGGGDIFINADIVGLSGLLDVSGFHGGTIDIGATSDIALADALLDASGVSSGGRVRVGGELTGGRDLSVDEVQNAARLIMEASARIDVSAQDGDGGAAILWSEEGTDFAGHIDARGGGQGQGGFAEVSSFGRLVFSGTADTGGGTLLLDPADIEIGSADTAIASSFIALTALDSALSSNDVVITTHDGGTSDEGHIYWTSDYAYSHANHLSLLAAGNIDFRGSLQNDDGTGGDINLVAGWDGSSGLTGSLTGGLQTDLAYDNSVFANADLSTQTVFGQTYDGGTSFGSVLIGNVGQTSGVAVGSRSGSTNVYGYDVTVSGSNTTAAAHALLGFHGAAASGDITGNIFAKAQSDASVSSGTGGNANAAFAQIGHGGFDFSLSSAFGNIGGNIDISVGGDVVVQATSAGGTNHNYAQIGHGGQGGAANGGSIGAVSGDITVTAAGEASVLGGGGVFGHYAQIGHLGSEFAKNSSSVTSVSGAVTVDAGSNINLTAGNVSANYAQIGHGGFDFALGSVMGNISGDIDATAGGDMVLQAGTGGSGFNYVQVGHGGQGGAAFGGSAGDVTGDISVSATGNVSLSGSSAGFAHYAQIGHLGSSFADTGSVGTVSGDVTVATGADLLLASGNNEAAYTQIGHGGFFFISSNGTVTSVEGDIAISAANDVQMSGGGGTRTYTQIGHLGYATTSLTATDINASGTITADIDGNLTVDAGSGTDAFAQIGFGGSNMRGTRSGAITITSVNDVSLQTDWASQWGYAQIGHGGGNNTDAFSGNITVEATGDLTLDAAGSSVGFTRLGHGGRNSDGAQSGDISITSVANVVLSGGRSYAPAQIGHGGWDTDGTKDGAITIVSTGDISIAGGPGSAASAQIGHGGGGFSADITGNISVTATGDLSIAGGALDEGYAMLGHGDGKVDVRPSSGQREGDITLALGGELSIQYADQSGQANRRGWLGHYTSTASGISNADLTVTATGFDEATGTSLSSGDDGAIDDILLDYAVGGGDVRLKATDTGLSLDGTLAVSSANDLTLIAANDITLASGLSYANSGSGNLIFAAGGDFHNDSGSTTPLGAGTGRWLVYSTRPDNNNNDIEITNRDFLRYAITFDELDPTPSGFSAGNGLIYSDTPLITYTANNQTLTYGNSISTSDFTAASGVTVSGSGVTAADFAIDLGSVTNTIALGLAGSVSVSGAGFAEAGSNSGGIERASGTVGNTWTGVGVDVIAGDLTVNQAGLTVTASDASKAYDGSAFSGGNGVTYSGFVTGEDETDLSGSVTYGGTSQGAVNAGSYTLTASGLTSGNYSISYGAGSLTVNPVALTVTAGNASKTYDGLAFSGGNGVSYSGFVGSEDESVLSGSVSYGGTAQGAVNAGTYVLSASGLSSGNYSISYVDGSLDVGAASLTVTANDASKTYDSLAYSGGNGVRYSGFVGSEDESALSGSVIYGGTAQGAVNAGTYVLSASGLSSGNYDISYVDGSLEAGKASLTATANSASVTYTGLAYSGGNGVTYSGFAGGEDEGVLSGSPGFGGSSQGAVNTGTYGLTVSGLSSVNYDISYVPASLQIVPAALTGRVNEAAVIFDGTAYAGGAGVTYSGFAAGEGADVLSGTLVYGGDAQGAAEIGTYALTASGHVSSNYDISYVDGSLEIMAARTVEDLAVDTAMPVVMEGVCRSEVITQIGPNETGGSGFLRGGVGFLQPVRVSASGASVC